MRINIDQKERIHTKFNTSSAMVPDCGELRQTWSQMTIAPAYDVAIYLDIESGSVLAVAGEAKDALNHVSCEGHNKRVHWSG